jgi:hypothetical protein
VIHMPPGNPCQFHHVGLEFLFCHTTRLKQNHLIAGSSGGVAGCRAVIAHGSAARREWNLGVGGRTYRWPSSGCLLAMCRFTCWKFR